jgi:cobaltochelatase CobN
MSAVMLETARKGYWNATEKQMKSLVKLHVRLVIKHQAGCSGFVCNNKKLRQLIKNKLDTNLQKQYEDILNSTLVSHNTRKGLTLEREKDKQEEAKNKKIKNIYIPLGLAVLIILIFFIGRLYRRFSRKSL